MTDTPKLREIISRALVERSLNNDPDPVIRRISSNYGDTVNAVIPQERLFGGTKSARDLLDPQMMRALAQPFAIRR